ncbi:MAG: GxxExxY protein [Crocinitomicaceae bacterium]|nr:GxxExxY protein [Crocinitomicaceae bacterium]
MITQKHINELTYHVIGECLIEELNSRNILFRKELNIPVIYKSRQLNIDFRCDLLVEDCLDFELKLVQILTNVYEA